VLDKELDSVLAALAFELVNKVVAVGALALMIMFGSVVCHVYLLRIYFFLFHYFVSPHATSNLVPL
jgi:hypothetical protein